MKMNIDGLIFSYKDVNVLDGIEMNVTSGDIVAVLGPNGVGKSTFLRCINNILTPNRGTVALDGRIVSLMPRRDIAKNIGYVSQKGEPSRVKVYEAVLLGRRPHIDIDVYERDYAITDRVIDLMGLGCLSMKYVDEISGGEYQLVQIARALVQQPKLLLLDEPSSNLDLSNQHMIMHILRRVIKNNGMAAIMVVHDLNLAVRHADKFVFIKDGKVFAAGGMETINEENIREVYGVDSYVETIHGIRVIIPKDQEVL